MKQLRPSTVHDATARLRQGKSVRETAREGGISIRQVLKIRESDKENIPEPRAGRHSKVSDNTKRILARKFDSGKITSLREGQQLIQSLNGVQVHIKSVWNYISKEGLKGYVQQKKPDLSEKHMHARLQFAKDHVHWTVDEWKNVMFSDETIISRIGSFGRKFYYKRPGNNSVQPHQVQSKKQGGGGKIMVWGCMTYYGVGDACWLPKKVNADTYVSVLDDYVLASRDWYRMNKRQFIFQHDNASIHTAAVVKEWIAKAKVAVMDWPPNSPDLNPIEYLWLYMKDKLYKYPEAPKNMDEFWERIQEIWTHIPGDYLQHLYESMPRRIEEVCRNKGGHTKY